MTYLSNDELVAVAWAKSTGVVAQDAVATTLPTPDSWPGNQFIQVTVVQGNPDRDTPINRVVVAFECYANRPGSARPPWGQANQIAQQLVMATYRVLAYPALVLAMPTGYSPARLMSVYPVGAARRVGSDPSRFARYTQDLQLVWAVQQAVPV